MTDTEIVAGEAVSDLAMHLPRPISAALVANLTPRQQYIVALLGDCDTFNEAAERLEVTPTALTARVRSISHRLGFANQSDFVRAARQHAVLDAVAYGIYGVDERGRCVFANRRAAETFGYTPDELIGRSAHEVLHHHHADGREYPLADCPILAAMTEPGARKAGTELFWHRDGHPVWVAFEVVPAGTGAENPVSVVTIEDRTPEMQAREEMVIREVRWDLALAAAGIIAFRIDLTTGEVMTSTNFAEFLGTDEDVAQTLDEFIQYVHPDDRYLVERTRDRAFAAGTMYQGEFRVIRADGSTRRLRGRMQVVSDAFGVGRTLVGVAADITEAVEAEAANRLILEMSSDAFVGMNHAGAITHWNTAAERLFGWTAEEVLGESFEMLIPERYLATDTEAVARLAAAAPPDTFARGPIEYSLRCSDGREIPVEIHVAALPTAHGVTFRAFVRDVSGRKALERALMERAITDDLTGLPNRVLLRDRIVTALEERSRDGDTRGVTVLFIDIDRFKIVNDSLGHAAGDDVLREIAARLRAAVRPGDTVARFGGDEFIVVCPGIDGDTAHEIGQRLLAAIAVPMAVGGRDLTVSASIGIALGSSADADELIRDADAAMYCAKELGGNRPELFAPTMRRDAVARLDMETALSRALERGEFEVHYQPIVSLVDGAINGVEALLRWTNPELGSVSPADFIPLAEETGSIVAIGEWVLRTACEQAAAWERDTGHRLRVTVNLSARQLADTDLLALVEDATSSAGIAPNRLCLEITENVLMEDSEATEMTLLGLRRLGVQLAVDDFGTGYSSLLYLRRFPVQVLKLDRMFVAGLGSDDQDTTIVRATIQLAHALGLEALAEGVERLEQLNTLTSMGCESAQGYLWSRAVPGDEITAMLRRHHAAERIRIA